MSSIFNFLDALIAVTLFPQGCAVLYLKPNQLVHQPHVKQSKYL